jgi:antitoxin component YwqK of YwqJK toxin-antitoxin module
LKKGASLQPFFLYNCTASFTNKIESLMKMQKFLLIIFLFFTTNFLMGQEIELIKGVYYLDKQLYTGTFEVFYPNGKLKNQWNISNGILDSISYSYFENGKIEEQKSYKNGLKDGLWILWDDKGVKLSEARYKDNLKDGNWIIWDANGVKRYDMYFLKGKKVGKWIMWDANGNIISEKEF